jgi:hypothetical protein
MMQNGMWITRDPKGDRSYAIWSTEPILSEAGDEWVPDNATGGRQVTVVVNESFAVHLLGHALRPGQIDFCSVGSKLALHAA